MHCSGQTQNFVWRNTRIIFYEALTFSFVFGNVCRWNCFLSSFQGRTKFEICNTYCYGPLVILLFHASVNIILSRTNKVFFCLNEAKKYSFQSKCFLSSIAMKTYFSYKEMLKPRSSKRQAKTLRKYVVEQPGT